MIYIMAVQVKKKCFLIKRKLPNGNRVEDGKKWWIHHTNQIPNPYRCKKRTSPLTKNEVFANKRTAPLTKKKKKFD